MKVSLVQKNWEISPDELKSKGFMGEIMWDIVCCDPNNCRSKEGYLELVEETAKEIAEKVLKWRRRNSDD